MDPCDVCGCNHNRWPPRLILEYAHDRVRVAENLCRLLSEALVKASDDDREQVERRLDEAYGAENAARLRFESLFWS